MQKFVEQGFGLASEAGCKASFSFSKADLAKRFLEFADAPDELIPGINYDEMPCPKGKKASKKCKEKNGESDDDKSPSITEDNSQPTQASNQPSTAKNEPSQTNNQPSSTTTDTGPTAKVDCAAIGREDLETLFETIPDEEEGGLVEKRTVGTTLQSRRLEPRNLKAKPGRTCKGFAGEQLGGGELKSKKYPTAGDSLMVGQAYT
jgi:hypothetical protein